MIFDDIFGGFVTLFSDSYAIWFVILASFVGWSRVHAKKHDYIDVLGGIIVGVGCVELFASKTKNYSINFSYDSQPNIIFNVLLN